MNSLTHEEVQTNYTWQASREEILAAGMTARSRHHRKQECDRNNNVRRACARERRNATGENFPVTQKGEQKSTNQRHEDVVSQWKRFAARFKKEHIPEKRSCVKTASTAQKKSPKKLISVKYCKRVELLYV